MKTSLLLLTIALSVSSQAAFAKKLKNPTPPAVPMVSERIIPGINLVCYEPGNVRLLRLQQDTWLADTGGKLLSSSASLLVLDQTGSQDQLATGERIASGTYEFKMDGIAVEVTIPSRQLSLQCGFDGQSIPMPSFGVTN